MWHERQQWVVAGRRERPLMGTSGLWCYPIKSAVRRKTAYSLDLPFTATYRMTASGREQSLDEGSYRPEVVPRAFSIGDCFRQLAAGQYHYLVGDFGWKAPSRFLLLNGICQPITTKKNPQRGSACWEWEGKDFTATCAKNSASRFTPCFSGVSGTSKPIAARVGGNCSANTRSQPACTKG